MLIGVPGLDPDHGLDVLGELSTVKKLFLEESGLRRLPEEVAGMTALESIELKSNELEELPAVLGKLPKLMVINAANNRIQRVPDAVLAMPGLVQLNLFGNPVPHEERERVRAVRPKLGVRFSE
jgi:Leucine-rich repeat (LRR) protein